MKYSKSILSLATILALGTGVNADTNAAYIPLTSKSFDNAWIMFGVNNFSTGIATVGSANGAFSTGYSVVSETSTSDDLASPSAAIIAAAAAGTIFEDSTGSKNMATFQALKDSSGNALITGALQLGVKTSDTTYSETQPVRTMYITIDASGYNTSVAYIKLDYKATLEGRTVELQLGGAGAVYRTTISQDNHSDNPAIAKDTAVAQTGTPLTAPADVLAYDLTNSPVNASAYSKTDHQQLNASTNVRFYNYDAQNSVWKIWDKDKTSATNTITDFEKGKAYWGRMDMQGTGTTTSTTRAGLVLGKTTATEANASVYSNLAAPGWNMLSFEPAGHPDIRAAATGLVVTVAAGAGGEVLDIYDETGSNKVSVTFTLAQAATALTIAQTINAAVESAKILGDVPASFNVKAFRGSADTELILLSDKQFTISQEAGGNTTTFVGVKTLRNVDPIDTDDGLSGAVVLGPLGTGAGLEGATSVYGEYTMIVEPLVGGTNASNLDNTVNGVVGGGAVTASAAVRFGTKTVADTTNIALAADNTATTLVTAKGTFVADEVFNGTKGTGAITEIDTDFSGTSDMLILASDTPFYIKDNTFTRQYVVDTTDKGTNSSARGNANVPYNISPADVTKTPADDDTAAAFATAINTVADEGTNDTGIYATSSGSTVVIVTAGSKVLELEDAKQADIDYFSKGSLSTDIVKGAIKRVLDISKLTREVPIKNKFEIKFTTDAGGTDGGAGNNEIIINSNAAGDTVIAAATNTDTLRLAMLNDFVQKANAVMKLNNIAGYASHNYIDGYNDISKAVITIEGVGLDSVTMTEDDNTLAFTGPTDANAATANTLNIDAAAITTDLKANAVYTPDYVMDGPLYTLKNAGYEAKVIVRASTKLAATPTTHWDHIDLTRAGSEWLTRNEFNLFSVDNSSGYWVYVDSYTNPNTISVSNVAYTPSYSYYFNVLDGTTENVINSATFSVDVANTNTKVTTASTTAKLLAGGKEIELTTTGSTYTATLTEPETDAIASNPGGTVELGVYVADGLGESYKDTNVTQFDYDEPVAPTATFPDFKTANISSTSSDTASIYIWQNYIPDDGTSPLAEGISTTAAAAYDVCKNTDANFATATPFTTSLQAVAVDGTGVFGKANISNIKTIKYLNAIKGATVLTHTKGVTDSISSVKVYDSSCVEDTNASKSGVEIKAQITADTVRLAYVADSGAISGTNDLPITAFYEIVNGDGAVIQVDYLANYASDIFFVEYKNNIYRGQFPATRTAADATFADADDLTLVTSDNKALQ